MNIKVLLIFNIIFLIIRYNTTSFTMGYLVQIPEVFDTQEMYDEVRDFVKRSVWTFNFASSTVLHREFNGYNQSVLSNNYLMNLVNILPTKFRWKLSLMGKKVTSALERRQSRKPLQRLNPTSNGKRNILKTSRNGLRSWETNNL